jgi:hypothetical protein
MTAKQDAFDVPRVDDGLAGRDPPDGVDEPAAVLHVVLDEVTGTAPCSSSRIA